MKKIKLKNKCGFTLIELLLVISIIALLSAIVLSNLQESRDKAKTVKFQQEVNEFIKAVELYKADNKGSIPGGGSGCYLHITNSNNITSVDDYCNILDGINNYLKDYPKPPVNNSYFIFFDKMAGDDVDQIGTECNSGAYQYIVLVSSNINGFENWSTAAGDYVGNCIQF